MNCTEIEMYTCIFHGHLMKFQIICSKIISSVLFKRWLYKNQCFLLYAVGDATDFSFQFLSFTYVVEYLSIYIVLKCILSMFLFLVH